MTQAPSGKQEVLVAVMVVQQQGVSAWSLTGELPLLTPVSLCRPPAVAARTNAAAAAVAAAADGDSEPGCRHSLQGS
jgi:hypothetical protein